MKTVCVLDEMDKLKLQLNEAHQTAYDHKQREAALEVLFLLRSELLSLGLFCSLLD
jgi:hypothetical protein